MDYLDDEEELECECEYINLLRTKRNIMDELWYEYISNQEYMEDHESDERRK